MTLISPRSYHWDNGPKGVYRLDQNYYECICKQCEEALLSNSEYVDLERQGADISEIQEVVEVVCYQKGYSDAVKMIINSL